MTSSATSTAAAPPRMLEHYGMPNDNDFMSVFDAAAFLGVHVQTLRRLARQKRIPAFKVGRDWKFSRESIVEWAKAQHVDDKDAIGCSVLVIDDEENVCKAMAGALKPLGCQTRYTTRAAHGLELVEEDLPDLVLLDLKMPDMNGPMFLRELRKTHPSLPVAVITGYPDSDLMQEAARYAPVMLLSKPVETELLYRTVQSVMGQNAVRTTR